MPKIIKIVTIFSFIITIFLTILFHYFHRDIYLTSSITFATITYHFGMRQLVGLVYEIRMKNRADYMRKWYQLHSWERKLYKFFRIKTWKNKLPTYRPENFSPEYFSWDEIAQAMCQAELVHETIIIFSFLPLLASVKFGAFYTFLITSICAALFDLMFVIIQRYNRDRVIKILLRKR